MTVRTGALSATRPRVWAFVATAAMVLGSACTEPTRDPSTRPQPLSGQAGAGNRAGVPVAEPIFVTPTPETADAAAQRIATVEAGAQEARLVPGYAATQTCERFRSSINGCRTNG